MTNVFLVSFPRSGQHFTQRLLERISGVDDYCQLYRCSVKNCPGKNFTVAERSPCPAGRRIQKTHDFDLGMPTSQECRYAVLVRSPLNSIQSRFEQDVRKHNGVLAIDAAGSRVRVAPDRWGWRAFLWAQAKYWNEFSTKWAAESEKNPAIVRLFDYRDLIESADMMRNVIDFCLLDYDESKATPVIEHQVNAHRMKLTPNRRVEDFEFFSPQDLADVDEITADGRAALLRVGVALRDDAQQEADGELT